MITAKSAFGFSVLPEELRSRPLIAHPDSDREDESGTRFVEVLGINHPKYPGLLIVHLYYKRNFSKWAAVTLDDLKMRFPRSFAQHDAGEEYRKAFRTP